MCIEIEIAVVTSRCVVMGVVCNAKSANFLETGDMGQMVSLCQLVFLLFPSPPHQHSPLLSAHSPFQKGRCSIQGNCMFVFVYIDLDTLVCFAAVIITAWSKRGPVRG